MKWADGSQLELLPHFFKEPEVLGVRGVGRNMDRERIPLTGSRSKAAVGLCVQLFPPGCRKALSNPRTPSDLLRTSSPLINCNLSKPQLKMFLKSPAWALRKIPVN